MGPAVSKSAERSGHEKQTSDVVRLEKYKNMLIKAKSKFQSKSEVPQSIVIQEDFQLNDDMAQFFINRNPKPSPSKVNATKEAHKGKKQQTSRESLEFEFE